MRKQVNLERFIYALGIREVGEVMAHSLAYHFGSLERLLDANREQLQDVEGAGELSAEYVHAFFSNPYNRDIVQRLCAVGVVMEKVVAKATITEGTQHLLQGKKFAFTGKLQSMGRQEAKERVVALGGLVKSQVVAGGYLVYGERPGSMLQRAQQRGDVKIVTEPEFLALLED